MPAVLSLNGATKSYSDADLAVGDVTVMTFGGGDTPPGGIAVGDILICLVRSYTLASGDRIGDHYLLEDGVEWEGLTSYGHTGLDGSASQTRLYRRLADGTSGDLPHVVATSSAGTGTISGRAQAHMFLIHPDTPFVLPLAAWDSGSLVGAPPGETGVTSSPGSYTDVGHGPVIPPAFAMSLATDPDTIPAMVDDNGFMTIYADDTGAPLCATVAALPLSIEMDFDFPTWANHDPIGAKWLLLPYALTLTEEAPPSEPPRVIFF